MQVAVGTQPLEEAVLAHVATRGLLDELRHLPHEDGGLRHLDGFREHHLGPVGGGLRFKGLPLLPLRLEVGSQSDDGVRIGQGLLQLGRGQVAAVLADGWHHVPGYPHLVGKGLGLVAAAKEEVEALLGDDEHFLLPARGVHPMHPLPFSGDGLHGSGRIVVVSIIQGPQHILSYEPGFTVHIHDAHGAELGILENLHVVHARPSFGARLEVFADDVDRSDEASDQDAGDKDAFHALHPSNHAHEPCRPGSRPESEQHDNEQGQQVKGEDPAQPVDRRGKVEEGGEVRHGAPPSPGVWLRDGP